MQKKNDDLIDSMLEMCDQMMSVVGESRAIDRYLDKTRDHNDKVYKKYQSYKKLDPELAEKYYDKNYKYEPGLDISKKYTYSGESGKKRLDKIYGSRKNYDTESENDYHRDMSFKKFGELEKIRKLDDIPDDKYANKKPNKYKDLQDKKRAIKETCLNILSIIDEL